MDDFFNFSFSQTSSSSSSHQTCSAVKTAPRLPISLLSQKGVKNDARTESKKRSILDEESGNSESSSEEDFENGHLAATLSKRNEEEERSSCDDEDHPSSKSLTLESSFIEDYTTLPDHSKMLSGVKCLVLSLKPKGEVEMKHDECLNYLNEVYSSCRLLNKSEQSKIFSPSSESRTPPLIQIARNLLDQSNDSATNGEEESELIRRAGILQSATIFRHVVLVKKNSSAPRLVVFNNFGSSDTYEVTSIVTYSFDTLLKPCRGGFAYQFMQFFKALLYCQVFDKFYFKKFFF